jgi:hypothetical protein
MSRYPKKPAPLRSTDELIKEIYLTIPESSKVARCCDAVTWEKVRRKVVRSKKQGRQRLIETASLLDHLKNLPEDEAA